MRRSTSIFVTLFAFAFLVLGLLLLWILNVIFGWNLDVLKDHSGFFQAWIYILQTFALVATLVYIGLQTKATQQAARINTVQLMVTAHRELLGKIVDHPTLFDAISGNDLPSDASSSMYISMLFNHGFNALSLREQNYIDDDWWAAIVRDMRDVIRRGPMRKRWSGIKEFYPSRYQTFVDKCILDN